VRAVERRTAHSAVEEFVVVKVFADRMIGVMATGTSDGLVLKWLVMQTPVQMQQNFTPVCPAPVGI